MNTQRITRQLLAAAIVTALAMGAAHAQDTTPAPAPAPAPPASQQPAAPAAAAPAGEQKSAKTLDQVVVTGTSAAGGIKKIDASYSVVSVNAEQIKQANPKSTADLLKVSPGMWPESTGGQTGANIEIAGFPGGGDAPFFTTQMMGSPLYGMPTLSFFETTSIFRLDDTVERAEILQGGPSVMYGDGQMGATANFILKQGTDVPSGSVGVTYGDEGLWRTDAFLGFPLGFFANGMFSPMGPFLSELFPTRVRGTAQGFAYNAGRAIGALFPTLVGLLSASMSLGAAIGMFTLCSYALLILVCLTLPETKGQELAA